MPLGSGRPVSRLQQLGCSGFLAGSPVSRGWLTKNFRKSVCPPPRGAGSLSLRLTPDGPSTTLLRAFMRAECPRRPSSGSGAGPSGGSGGASSRTCKQLSLARWDRGMWARRSRAERSGALFRAKATSFPLRDSARFARRLASAVAFLLSSPSPLCSHHFETSHPMLDAPGAAPPMASRWRVSRGPQQQAPSFVLTDSSRAVLSSRASKSKPS